MFKGLLGAVFAVTATLAVAPSAASAQVHGPAGYAEVVPVQYYRGDRHRGYRGDRGYRRDRGYYRGGRYGYRGGYGYPRGYAIYGGRPGYYADRGYYHGGRGYYGCDRGTGGTIVGAIAGGLLGNAIGEGSGRYGRGDGTAGAIIGAGVGALAGREIDRSC